MWVAIVSVPELPRYAIHQYLWGFFDVAEGDERPFLFRQVGARALLLCRKPPKAPSVFIADRVKAGRSYGFDALVNLRNGVHINGERRYRFVTDNDERKAWLGRNIQGGRFRFLQFYDRPPEQFTKADRVKVRLRPTIARGVIEVTDRTAFCEWLLKGPGTGKAWGCGLVYLPDAMQDVARIAA